MSNVVFFLNWVSFLFFSLGAIGGVVYLVELLLDLNNVRKSRSLRCSITPDEPWFDDPVENIVQLHPQQTTKEAPISARHK